MRKLRTAVLAGCAAVVAVGTAVAASHDTHALRIAMPDGSIARIEYQGDVAPRVTLAPATPVALFEPFDSAPFAAFDRVAAQIDRDMDAMIRQTATLSAAPSLTPDGTLDMAAFGKLPAGTMHYSFVSTSTGNGTCNRTVQMTSYGVNQQPKVVQTSSGDCKGMPSVTPAAADGDTVVMPQPAKPRAPLPATT
jgi:hypothetical protein